MIHPLSTIYPSIQPFFSWLSTIATTKKMHKNKNPTKISDRVIMFSLLSGFFWAINPWRLPGVPRGTRHRIAQHGPTLRQHQQTQCRRHRCWGQRCWEFTPSLDEFHGWVFLCFLKGKSGHRKAPRCSGDEAFRFQNFPLRKPIHWWMVEHVDPKITWTMGGSLLGLDTFQTSWNKICKKHDKS